MGKYIKTYLNAVEQLLADENRSVDMRALKKEHEKQIGFIQHERLIHLIVTVMVVIVLFISIVIYFITAITGIAFVCGLLLALTFA